MHRTGSGQHMRFIGTAYAPQGEQPQRIDTAFAPHLDKSCSTSLPTPCYFVSITTTWNSSNFTSVSMKTRESMAWKVFPPSSKV